MRKAEMTAGQRSARDLMSAVLTANGWDGSQNEGFEEGLWKYFEADFDRRNARGTRLHWRYEAQNAVVYLVLHLPGGVVGLHLQFGDRLQDVLNTLISFQDTIDADNFRDCVQALVRVCPKVLAAVGEDEQLVELTAGSKAPAPVPADGDEE